MTSSSWDRSRRITAAASALAVLAVAVGMLVLALPLSVPAGVVGFRVLLGCGG
ncbi:hypothetical protein [Streptomyces sp. NPDC046197]|uniref:hypothetical protein n=1 Tax=Streptomyces sp. NPDC046197 TaxID=3154337 RepID=UPI0033E1F371